MYPPIPCLHTRTGGEFIVAARLKPGFGLLDTDVRGNLDAPMYLAQAGSWVCAQAVVPNAWIRRGTYTWEPA